MIDDSSDARDGSAESSPDTAGRDLAKLPRIAMLFSASTWTFNVRLGRTGREEGEGVIIMGEVSYRTPNGERRVHPARAMVVKSDARKRLDIALSPQEAVLTIPLEPFAMQRLQDRMKELVSYYGMTLRVAFSAADSTERQPIDHVDFAFSSGARPMQSARPAQAGDR
jgi:hypothetical protein